MIEYKLTGIDWDTDGESVELPSEMVVEVESDDEDTMQDAAIDAASNKTSWCIKGVATIERVES